MERGGTHRLGSLDHTGVYLAQGGLYHAGDKGGRRYDQRYNGAFHAYSGSRHHTGEGQNCHQQNDKGERTSYIDDPIQHPVESPMRPDAMGLRQNQCHPQGQAEKIGKYRGDTGHQQGVSNAFH